MEAVTENDLLEAIRKAMDAEPELGDGMTTIEIHKALGITRSAADKLVGQLCDEGLLVPVKVPRRARDGHIRPRTAYTFARG